MRLPPSAQGEGLAKSISPAVTFREGLGKSLSLTAHARGGALRHAVACLALFFATAATAQSNLLDEQIDPSNGTRIQVRSVFDPLPPSGYAPVRVVGTNGSTRDDRWNFDFNSQTTNYRANNRHGSAFTLDMPARSTQSALFLVPLAVDYGDSSGYRNHNFTVRVGEKTGSNHANRSADMPAIAISETLAESSITALNKETDSKSTTRSNDVFGSRFVIDDLPETWLGYSGFDFVMLSSTEWQKLKPAVRRALLEWVRFGGKLHLYLTTTETAATLGLAVPDADGTIKHSLGRITLLKWDGNKLPPAETVKRYWGERQRVESLTDDHTNASDWPLSRLMGDRSFASWQVILFLVLFGLLVGPVNLFLLAPAGKRHRLFVTTPIISVGASLIMIVLILVQDGTGGEGRRWISINLEPADAAAYVTQEQISRTGVLLGAAFEMKQPALVEPIAMPDSQWVKLKKGNLSQPTDLTSIGRERSGSFFQSRAEQGHILRTAVSTRARLELKPATIPDAAPTVVSALGFTVEDLFYADATGQWWRLEASLSTGQSATLVKTDPKTQKERWEAALITSEMNLRRRVMASREEPKSFFFAKARTAPDFTQETLSSIRWEEDQIVVFGPVVQP